jgi:hypothetical protein
MISNCYYVYLCRSFHYAIKRELRTTNTPYEHVSTYQNITVLDFLSYQYARFKVAVMEQVNGYPKLNQRQGQIVLIHLGLRTLCYARYATYMMVSLFVIEWNEPILSF